MRSWRRGTAAALFEGRGRTYFWCVGWITAGPGSGWAATRSGRGHRTGRRHSAGRPPRTDRLGRPPGHRHLHRAGDRPAHVRHRRIGQLPRDGALPHRLRPGRDAGERRRDLAGQALIPAALIGRVTAVHRVVCWGVLPLGALASGLAGQFLGVRTAIASAGAPSWSCPWSSSPACCAFPPRPTPAKRT